MLDQSVVTTEEKVRRIAPFAEVDSIGGFRHVIVRHAGEKRGRKAVVVFPRIPSWSHFRDAARWTHHAATGALQPKPLPHLADLGVPCRVVERAVEHDTDSLLTVGFNELLELLHRVLSVVLIAQNRIDLPVVFHGVGRAGVILGVGQRVDLPADRADGVHWLEPNQVHAEILQFERANGAGPASLRLEHVAEGRATGKVVALRLCRQRIQLVNRGVQNVARRNHCRSVPTQPVVGVINPRTVTDLPARIDAVSAAFANRQCNPIATAADRTHGVAQEISVQRRRCDAVSIFLSGQFGELAAVEVGEKLDLRYLIVSASARLKVHRDPLLFPARLIDEKAPQTVVRILLVGSNRGPHFRAAVVESPIGILVAD